MADENLKKIDDELENEKLNDEELEQIAGGGTPLNPKTPLTPENIKSEPMKCGAYLNFYKGHYLLPDNFTENNRVEAIQPSMSSLNPKTPLLFIF